MRKCAMQNCPGQVREGLRRFGKGVDGQELADGTFCWRCRSGRKKHLLKPVKRKGA